MDIIVACPNCTYELHLPNRDFLGRKGKCPSCEHKFVMQETQAAATPQPDLPPVPAKQPPAKPATVQKPKPIARSKPAEDWDRDRKTVVGSGQTHSDSDPVPSPVDSSFQDLKDPDDEDDSEAGDASPITFADAPATDSAVVPDEIWEDIEVPETAGESLGDLSNQRSAAFDIVARCPHCHAGVDFKRDDDLRDFLCARCGKQFSLIHPESPAGALAMPKQVGVYLLQKHPRIGLGPFGSVYRAKDGQSGEFVAVKVSRGDQVSEAEREKFLTTLRSVMQLKHPSIASLHELDCVDGRVYTVSSYVSGIDLSEYLIGLPERQLSIREVASTCALIASVLHHGHKFGVIHGNLKPTNIRIDADQKPYILDFGLSQRERGVQMTANGRIVGTAAYLAPEQLPGSRRDPTPLTDVFAMGVIFYELLTGRRPFPGQGPELLKQIAKGGPPSPRSIKPEIPKPLDTICLKCLEVDPRDRYKSAMDVYKELRLYLEDKPIHTKAPSVFKRLSRWRRRRPFMAGLLLLLITAAVAGAGFLSFQLF